MSRSFSLCFWSKPSRLAHLSHVAVLSPLLDTDRLSLHQGTAVVCTPGACFLHISRARGLSSRPVVVVCVCCAVLQEKKLIPFATHMSCTVEMVAVDRAIDVAVIDEVQMIGDDFRGWAWTRALMGVPVSPPPTHPSSHEPTM